MYVCISVKQNSRREKKKGVIMSEVDSFIERAKSSLENGNHEEAIVNLTKAARSNPNDSQMSVIEILIRKIAEYIIGNSSGSNDRGAGNVGDMASILMRTFMSSNNGSSQSQLGKLALLTTLISHGTNTGNGSGFNLNSVISMFSNHQQQQNGSAVSFMGSAALASLTSQFFSNTNQQQQHNGNGGSFANLAAMASSYLSSSNNNNNNNNNGNYDSYNNNSNRPNNQQYGQGYNQSHYNSNSNPVPSLGSTLFSIASSYMSNGNRNNTNGNFQQH